MFIMALGKMINCILRTWKKKYMYVLSLFYLQQSYKYETHEHFQNL